MEFVAQVAGKIVDCTVGKIGEQLGYLIDYKGNIEALKEKIENLKGKREELQQKIIEAENNLEIIHGHVKKWDEHVVEITKDIDNLLEDDQKEATYRCFNGSCINMWARYKFGKKAFEKANEITKLVETKFESVSYHLHDLTVTKPSSSREMFRGFESRKKKVRDIVKALDDENISMIGICGMGGVGKTTIVKEVRTQTEEEKKFDKIVMVVVSQNPNFTKIQDDIAKELGLRLEEWPNISAALKERIKREKKIMIILDNVWKRFDLIEDVGIPFGEDHKGCKIVLTTREENVCWQMDAQTFHIEGLPEPEDWLLFRETLGETTDSLDSELENIAIEVARACRGLPIAIVTVGMALKKQNKDVWIDFSEQLKKPIPSNIPGMDGFVYSSLELSYRYLESSEAKSLFLLCSLFPEDFEINVGSLAQYGMALRLFQDVNTIKGGRVRSRSLVSTLISSFLLLEGQRDGHVKMHDVIRDAAIVIASKEEEKKYIVKVSVGLRDWPNSEMTASFQNYTGISLMYNDIHELPDEFESPKLQVLLLQNNYELHIPTNFLQGMKNLKVLDMGGNRIRFMPTSIQWLTSLKTLCLDGCKLGDNISIIGTLKQLEILNLRKSDIIEVPGNFCQLTHLMSLDLRECSCLKKITPGVISSLCKLEELYIALNFIYWVGIDGGEDSRSNASVAELKSLSRLTSLSICVPNVNLLPQDLKLQSLTEFDIIIGCKEYQFHDYKWPVNHRLALSYETANYRLSVVVHDLLKRTKSLILIDCKGSTNTLKDFDNNEGFVELEYLYVSKCDDMKCLLDTVDGIPPRLAFPNLKQLRLFSLPNFMEICHGQLPAESFSKLQKLDVQFCDSMSNVFDLEGLAIGDDQLDDIKLLSSLEKLHLSDLPNLIHVWKGPHYHFVKLHNQLRSVVLSECPNLRQLFPPSIAQSLVHLETLFVWNCNDLKCLLDTVDGIPPRLAFPNLKELRLNSLPNFMEICHGQLPAESFSKLQKLEVESCDSMSNVFDLEGLAIGDDQLDDIKLLSSLEELSLFELPNLIHVWKGPHDHFVKVHNLKYVFVLKCHNLRQLFPPPITQSLVHLEKLNVRFCHTMEEIFETYNEDGINPTNTVGKSLNTNIGFTNLVTVYVRSCNSLRNIFTPSIAKGFAQLTELYVSYCGMMKAVVELEDDPRKEGDEAHALSAENIKLFPRLVGITLLVLENISCFCTSHGTITFPSLQELVIKNCTKMETFSNGVVCNNTQPKQSLCWLGRRNLEG